jgi:uncharacterized membrane protein YfcA
VSTLASLCAFLCAWGIISSVFGSHHKHTWRYTLLCALGLLASLWLGVWLAISAQ